MNRLITTCALTVLSVLCAAVAHPGEQPDAPNIVYIALEDITPMMGCYGDAYAETPNFDNPTRRTGKSVVQAEVGTSALKAIGGRIAESQTAHDTLVGDRVPLHIPSHHRRRDLLPLVEQTAGVPVDRLRRSTDGSNINFESTAS